MTPLPHSARTLPASLHHLLERQFLLASVAQLRDAGVTREQLRWGLARRWSAPLPGVVDVADTALDDTRRAMAAVLYAGPGSLLAGPSAAALWGVRTAAGTPLVHVVVSGHRSSRAALWAQVHRTGVVDPFPREVSGVPVCSPTRAVVDAARWATSDEQAQAIVIEACQRRLVTPQTLRDILTGFGRAAGTARARCAVEAAETGAWSIPEFRLVQAISTSRTLPKPWTNPVLRSPAGRAFVSPDLWFDDVGLAVMVHSKAHHRIGDDWVRTVESDGALTAAGAHVLGVTPTSIGRDVAAVVRRIEAAYLTARRLPRTTSIVAHPRRS